MRSYWREGRLVMPGMNREGTGGGHEAYLMFLPSHHVLVTNGDAMIPYDGDEIVVGLYPGGLAEVEDEGGVGSVSPEDDWVIDPGEGQLEELDKLIADLERIHRPWRSE